MKSSQYVQKYLNRAQNSANESYANFGGDRGYANFTANPANRGAFFNADASAAAPAMQSAPAQQAAAAPSRPYFITISNSTGSAIPNFDILGAFQYIANAGFNANTGNLVISGVTISSGLANVNYQFLLNQTNVVPFTVGSTLLQSIVNAAQITVPINVTTTDASGQQYSAPLIPVFDPYQQQNGTIVINTAYRVDGSTKLTFSSIQPNAVFNVLIYPAATIDQARGLVDSSAQRGFSAPGIIRTNTTVVGGTAVVSRINN